MWGSKPEPKVVPTLAITDPAANEEEMKIIAQLKGELAEVEGIDRVTTECFLRFIRGYSKEEKPYEACKDYLKTMLEWREEKKMDTTKFTRHPKRALYSKGWPGGIHGVDKLGHPVFIEKLGLSEPDILMNELAIEEVLDCHAQVMEALVDMKDNMNASQGTTMYKHVHILDLGGLGTKHMSKSLLTPIRACIDMDGNKYPESLYRMIIVNSPWIFRAFWAMIKPFIHPLTVQKILWGEEHLKEYIDDENIANYLGGKCKCVTCCETPFVSGKDPADELTVLAVRAAQEATWYIAGEGPPAGYVSLVDEKKGASADVAAVTTAMAGASVTATDSGSGDGGVDVAFENDDGAEAKTADF